MIKTNGRLTLIAMAVLSLATTGCAPRVLSHTAAHWPREWAGRTLYDTSNAYVYAGSATSALEADRLAASAAKRFASQTDGRASKGLLVVTDIDDAPLIADLTELITMIDTDGKLGDSPEAIAAAVSEKVAETEAELSELGLPAELLFNSIPLPLTPDYLSGSLGLPKAAADSVEWAASVPTKRQLKRFMKEIVRAGMAQEDINWITRALMAPMLVVAESMAVKELAKSRETMLLALHVDGQPGWSSEQKLKYRKSFGVESSNDDESGIDSILEFPD